MADRDRILSYLTALIAVFVFAYVAGWLAGPSLGYGDQPARAPSHGSTPDGTGNGSVDPHG